MCPVMQRIAADELHVERHHFPADADVRARSRPARTGGGRRFSPRQRLPAGFRPACAASSSLSSILESSAFHAAVLARKSSSDSFCRPASISLIRATTGRIFFTSRSFFDRKNFSEKIHNYLSITLVKMNGYATRRIAQRQSESNGKKWVRPANGPGRRGWPGGGRGSGRVPDHGLGALGVVGNQLEIRAQGRILAMLDQHPVGIAADDGQDVVQLMRHIAPDLLLRVGTEVAQGVNSPGLPVPCFGVIFI